jgi:hypothetical protein
MFARLFSPLALIAVLIWMVSTLPYLVAFARALVP